MTLRLEKIIVNDVVAQDATFCDLFVEFSPYLKMYSVYTSSHEDASKLLSNLMSSQKHEKFQRFLETASAEGKLSQAGVADYLIQPIQRV